MPTCAAQPTDGSRERWPPTWASLRPHHKADHLLCRCRLGSCMESVTTRADGLRWQRMNANTGSLTRWKEKGNEGGREGVPRVHRPNGEFAEIPADMAVKPRVRPRPSARRQLVKPDTNFAYQTSTDRPTDATRTGGGGRTRTADGQGRQEFSFLRCEQQVYCYCRRRRGGQAYFSQHMLEEEVCV